MSTSTPFAPGELARRGEGGALDFRADPVRVRLVFSSLRASDRHDVTCAFDASVRVADSRSDRQLLSEILLGDRAVLRRDDVTDYLARQAAAGVQVFVSGR